MTDRRRPRLGATLLLGALALTVLAVAAAPSGGTISSWWQEVRGGDSDTGGPGSEDGEEPASRGVLEDDGGAGPVERTTPIGHDGWTAGRVNRWEGRHLPAPLVAVEDLELLTPILDPVVVGFHEASTAAGVEMRPLGPLVGNANSTRYTKPAEYRDDGIPYKVLASRGRAAGPTTAVDVVARPDERVVAPVTGHVTDVRSYALYGRHPDQRVEVRPLKAPSVRVVLVHVSEVGVEVGDLVIAGTSVIADRATEFPFTSQIDRETEPDFFPHVHLEVQPFDARRPGDPDPEDEDPPPS